MREALEVHHRLRDEVGKAVHVADAEHAQVLLRGEEVHHAGCELGGHDHLGVVLHDELRRLHVACAVEGNRAAERGEAVGLVRAEVRLGERVRLRHAARVVVLHDHGAGLGREVAEDVERVVGVRHVRLAGVLAALEELGHGRQVAPGLDRLDVAEHDVAVHELVERGFLTGVLAIAETLLLAADVPRHLLVAERLALVAGDERNLHLRREVVGFDGLVRFLEVFHFCSFRFLLKSFHSPEKTRMAFLTSSFMASYAAYSTSWRYFVRPEAMHCAAAS